MKEIIQQQLKKVLYANLDNFDEETYTYIIPKKCDIKVEEDSCYLIHIRPTAKHNVAVNTNWNNGSVVPFCDMKVDVSKKMGKMIKVTGIGYDASEGKDLSQFWSGWLSLDDIEVSSKL